MTEEPTCEGVGEKTYTCKRCGETKTEEIPALEHNWGEPSYEWTETDGVWYCTGTIVCANNAEHKLEETVQATSAITTVPTADDPGVRTWTAVFTNAAFAEQTKTVEFDGEFIDVYVIDKTNAEEIRIWAWGAAGNIAASFDDRPLMEAQGTAFADVETNPVACTYYKYSIEKNCFGDGLKFTVGNDQTGNLEYVAAAGELDHVVYYLYYGNGLEASSSDKLWIEGETHEADCEHGSYTTYKNLFDETDTANGPENDDKLDHVWGAPTYVWTETEDGWSCTATVVCERYETHTLSETAPATYEETTAPGATTPGTGVWTAVFENELFETQTKEVQLEPTGVDNRLKISTNVNAEDEIFVAFSFNKNAAETYASFYLELTVTDHEGHSTTLRYGDGQANELTVQTGLIPRLAVQYNGIAAKMMGAEYTAQVHAFTADGTEVVSPAVEGSVRDFLMGLLLDESNSNEKRTLAADMLEYGAQAQIYFDYDANNLVNVGKTDEEQAALDAFRTPGPAPVDPDVKVTQTEDFTYKVTCNVVLDNKILLTVTAAVKNPAETMEFVMTDANGNEVERLPATAASLPGRYYAKFDSIGVADMRTLYSFVLVDGSGTALSNKLTWSLEAYANESAVTGNPSLQAMVNAILIYSDSLNAFKASINP